MGEEAIGLSVFWNLLRRPQSDSRQKRKTHDNCEQAND
jgi:hypothetical protein